MTWNLYIIRWLLYRINWIERQGSFGRCSRYVTSMNILLSQKLVFLISLCSYSYLLSWHFDEKDYTADTSNRSEFPPWVARRFFRGDEKLSHQRSLEKSSWGDFGHLFQIQSLLKLPWGGVPDTSHWAEAPGENLGHAAETMSLCGWERLGIIPEELEEPCVGTSALTAGKDLNEITFTFYFRGFIEVYQSC